MQPKYMLNLIQANLSHVASQVSDDLTFLPDVYDSGSTLVYNEQTKRIVERKLVEAERLLREAAKLLEPCLVQATEPKCKPVKVVGGTCVYLTAEFVEAL